MLCIKSWLRTAVLERKISTPFLHYWATAMYSNRRNTMQDLHLSLRLAILHTDWMKTPRRSRWKKKKKKKSKLEVTQFWKPATDLKCALAMVASEARLVIYDTVCCQLLHQIHSLLTRLALLLCTGKRHRSTKGFLLLVRKSFPL